jgi:hypothetical protein
MEAGVPALLLFPPPPAENICLGKAVFTELSSRVAVPQAFLPHVLAAEPRLEC